MVMDCMCLGRMMRVMESMLSLEVVIPMREGCLMERPSGLESTKQRM